MNTKMHFRRKTIEVLVPVLGSGFEVRIELFKGWERTVSEYKKLQEMFKHIEKDGKPN